MISKALKPSLRAHIRRAFSLTEILVAIALLLIIMVSVATIFRSSSQAVAVGIAVTDQNRALAAFSQQMQQDVTGYLDSNPFSTMAGMYAVNQVTSPTAPPFLFIQNATQAAYPNRATEVSGGAMSNYRLDSIGFFTNGAFRRQTGSPNLLVDEMPVMTRAYVWYGHVNLPDNSGAPWGPGLGSFATNPYNWCANQWIIGRRAVLLADPGRDPTPPTPGAGQIYSYGGPVTYYGRWWTAAANGGNFSTFLLGSQWDPQNFTPLGDDQNPGNKSTDVIYSNPMSIDNGTAGAGTLDTTQVVTGSRYDIAGLNREQTWQDYANGVQAYQSAYEIGGGGPYTYPWAWRYFSSRHFASLAEALDIDWSVGSIANNQAAFASTASRSVPVSLRNCTTFIVEFAGDYVTQNPATGAVTGAPYPPLKAIDPSTWHMDGVTDFDVVPVPNSSPVQYTRRTHWYGMPRVVAAAYTDSVGNNIPAERVTTVTEARNNSGTLPANSPVPFEYYAPSTGPTYCCYGWSRDMLCLPDAATNRLSFAPQLIRVTVTVTDPQGRVLEDMTRQYIFPVKHN